MKAKIEIRTPDGSAKSTEYQIMPFIISPLARKKIKIESYVNDENNCIYWEIEGEARAVMQVLRNVSMYDVVIHRVMDNKFFKRQIRTRVLSKDDEEKLKELLTKQTKIRIIKDAEAEELVEINKTFWQRMKEKFKRD